MTIETMRERIGASRGKLALVGVLVVVLVGAIVVQLPGSSNTDNAPTAPISSMPGLEATASGGAESANVPSSTEKISLDEPPRNWPELSVKAIVAFDPLTAPSWYLAATHVEQNHQQDDSTLTSAETEAGAAALEALQHEGATIVLMANGERIATIGEQRIHIGDRIEGYQVSDITDQGVILTKSRSR